MSLKHAILVLLSDQPASGYELVQEFRSGIGNFWKATHQQVYLELKKMHGEKLVRYEVETQDTRPEKKTYSMTAAGRRALTDWFLHPAKPPKVRDPLLVKVYGAALARPAVLIAELRARLAAHEKQVENYRRMEQHYFDQDEPVRRQYLHPYLTLRRGIRYECESTEWLREVLQLLESGELPAKPVGR